MDRVSRRRKLFNKLMGTLLNDLLNICSCIAATPWHLFILFTAIGKRVVQLCAADNSQFRLIVMVPHEIDWLIVDFFSLIVKTIWDLFILITLIAVPVHVDFFISPRRYKKERAETGEKKEDLKQASYFEDSEDWSDFSYFEDSSDFEDSLDFELKPRGLGRKKGGDGVKGGRDRKQASRSEDSSHGTEFENQESGEWSFPITDLFPSAAVSTPGAASAFTRPHIDHGGISVQSDQNVVFTSLEEEHEGWLEQIIESVRRESSSSDPAQASMQIMPTIPHQVSSVTSFKIPNLPTLQQEVDKLITTPSSSQPRVDEEITSITESITLHNLDQECSRETEINLSMNEKLDSSLQGIQISQHASSSAIHSEAFKHGGVISVVFDPTNTGVEVVNIDNNFTTQAHSEIKSTIHTCEITSQDLQKVVGLKRSDAAKTLGVSVSTFKRIGRHYKISKWPDYRNIKQCSVLKEKLKLHSIQAAEGPSTRSSHTEGVGSSHQNSPGFEPERRGQKTTLSPCKIVSTGAQNDNLQSSKDVTNPCYLAVDVAMQEAKGVTEFSRPILTDPALEQDLATFPPMVPNVRRMQDARTWTIKATYGKYKLRFQLSSKKFVELKDEVAKRLQLELNSFDIHYEDDDKEWILIACDEDLEVCLDFSSSMGNQKTRLLITDKNCQLIS